MRSEAFSIGMWSGAGFEKLATRAEIAQTNKWLLKHLLAKARKVPARGSRAGGRVLKRPNQYYGELTGGKPVKRGGGGGAPKQTVAPEPGFFDSLTPGKVGLGLGIPAGILGYMAGSEPATLPPPPMMNPLMNPMMMQGMYGMPGGYQIPTPPSAGTPL